MKFLLRLALTTALVWLLAQSFGTTFVVTGGWPAYGIIAALITVLNVLVEPVLKIVTFPLKLLSGILAIILVNGIFLWLTVQAVELLPVTFVSLLIAGGIPGWLMMTVLLGLGKWVIKSVVK